MKRILLTGMLFLGLGVNAQLTNGSIAPDFTLTDINGNTHNLYTYLNAGKTVFIDISATWCGPCWSYHETHNLQNLWVEHGPAGGTGVSSSTTDDVIVLFIEGDGTTDNAQLNGAAGSQGNWVTGTSYPICNPASSVINPILIDYEIAFFPTVYKICPNRQVFEVGTASTTSLYNSVSSCISFSGNNNPALIGYIGETSSCGSIDVMVTLQNMGVADLTVATIVLKQGSTVLNTYNWTGNLGTFEIANVNVGTVTPVGATTYTIEITSADDVPGNNTLTQVLTGSPIATTSAITVEIITDAFGSDNSWELINENGVTIASGGPYQDGTENGAIVQTPVTYITPNPNECYEFVLYDVYGDGMVTDFGTGSYTVKDGANNVLLSGGEFEATEVSGRFKSGSGGGTGTNGMNEWMDAKFAVFPNPATDQVHVKFDAQDVDYTIALMDISGRIIFTNTYTKVTGAQEISIPVMNISKGNYILNISGEGVLFNQKIMIK